ncbi:MAG: helix-turn-helix domain-containing protein, partial [Propionibacteriales bacterium]|nr:helix-turn-helix domain-containing protein [Propionibacteriales bacterium]
MTPPEHPASPTGSTHPASLESPRTLTDAQSLAAFAHPFRARMLDALSVVGPSTASALAQRTGQAV